MEYKEFFGIVSALIAVGVSLSYIYSIVRGGTKPHLYTVVIDLITSCIVLAGAFVSGAGAGIWNLAVATLFLIVMLALTFKYGTKDVTRLDAVFATGAVLSIVPWVLTDDPTYSVVLASLIMVLSLLPAVRKTWNDPTTEPWTIWGMNAVKHMVAIPATSIFSIATLTYPLLIIATNILFTLMILYRRRQKRR